MRLVVGYLGALVAFLAIDITWLSVIARDFYRERLAHLLAQQFDLTAAFVFYALYVAGVTWLVVRPALAAGRLGQAARDGAIFGLVAYATYDLTNLATLRDWPLDVTLVDMAWGALLTTATACAGYLSARAVSRG